MEYRVLGRTGLRISPICFGTGNFAEPTPEDEAKRMIDRALDAGVNLLGTGNIYADGEGERFIGRALKENGRRHETLIATKIFPGAFDASHGTRPYTPGRDPNEQAHSRAGILKSCEDCLKRLQTDYIDVYLTHRHDAASPPLDELAIRSLIVSLRPGVPIVLQAIGVLAHRLLGVRLDL